MIDENEAPSHFNIGEAITQPFRLPGGKGFFLRLLFWSSLLSGGLFLIFGKALISSYFEFFRVTLELETSENPADMLPMIRVMFGMMIPAMMLSIGTWAIMVSAETAMHKNIFFGTDHGRFPLRFALPELYVTLAQIVVYGIVMCVYFAGYMAFIFIILLVVLLSQVAEVFAIIGVLLGLVGFFALMMALLTAFMRFAPAAALSVRDNDIRLLEGWNITKGRFWPLFASYCAVGIGGYFIISFVMGIFGIFIFGDGALLRAFETIDTSNTEDVLNALSDIFNTGKVKFGLAVGMIALVILNFIWKSCIWGIANYAARIGPFGR